MIAIKNFKVTAINPRTNIKEIVTFYDIKFAKEYERTLVKQGYKNVRFSKIL